PSVVSPDAVTWESRTSSWTRDAAISARNETIGCPAIRKRPGGSPASAATCAAGTTYVATSPGTTSGGGAAQTVVICSHPTNTNGSAKRPPPFAGLNVSTASPGRSSLAAAVERSSIDATRSTSALSNGTLRPRVTAAETS